MAARRVVITGVGVVSALGNNACEFWKSVVEGRCGIGPIDLLDCSRLRFRNGAQVRNYRPEDHFDPKKTAYLDRFAQFGVVAAREAVQDAGIAWTPELRARTAIVTGCCTGGQTAEDAAFQEVYQRNGPRVSPLTIPLIMANAAASSISMETGVTGPAYTISTACSSSSHAIGNAFWLVRNGVCEAAIAGGSEAPFSFGNLKAWEAIRVVSPDTCRPFSKDRRGMIIGEGAAMMVLEPLDAALARGVPIYAEIVGFGMSSDASHITQPSSEGAALAMRGALADAGLQPEQIRYINAHGTGTEVNDVTETAAIRMVFGEHTGRLSVSSTKSMHGHALGAAGALEAVAATLALREGILPPTANFTTPDPRCELDVVPNQARACADAEFAISNSFAFGGLNAVLAFRKIV